ncbi:hypothetical protein LCGC14_0405800 [marine sediment metagenome]|uniref:Uncharacterized protein n=1 Tax=marine sediment metagenome TaxID=412755 RepID=A0A0F9VH98_9ZZZZ
MKPTYEDLLKENEELKEEIKILKIWYAKKKRLYDDALDIARLVRHQMEILDE